MVGAWWVQRPSTLYDSGASLGTPPTGTLARPADSVAGIAQRVLPVVVSIDVRGADGGGTGSGFVIRLGRLRAHEQPRGRATAATGGSITVHFNDGSTTSGRIVGRSPAYDLAVLKVLRTGLPVATLGNSDAVVVGDECIAVGSPLGLAGTVTTGIISATHRPVTTGGRRRQRAVVPVRAADRRRDQPRQLRRPARRRPGPGHRGQLRDRDPRVEQPVRRRRPGRSALGFSIPVNQARRVAEQLIQRGYATHPVVGASLDPAYDGEGVRISRVQPGGGADRAGLQAG